MSSLSRRALLGAAAWPLAACTPPTASAWQGGWVGDGAARGHALREAASLHAPAVQRRCDVAIVGGGIAGLAAARAARRAGIDDIALFELHDVPGGNSRGHRIDSHACPLGAHYLPLPGPQAHEVHEWLHEIGVARREAGRTVYDERHLCHSPQERLFVDGAWHDGLLPPADPGSPLHAQWRRFGAFVAEAQRSLGFALPTRRARWSAAHAALDAQTFAQWLDGERLDDARLRWWLDYCCRDDYGAPAAEVSAWAGLHYFASRHGGAPGDVRDDSARDAVLTWPEGNAWLVERLAAPLGERLHGGCIVRRIAVERQGVAIDIWREAAQRAERWHCAQAVLGLPLYVAARVVESPPEALRAAAARLRYAPWLVANLQLREPLVERLGAPMAWDNVIYASRALGYVNAQHQRLDAVPRPTLLTAYHALPLARRAALLAAPWQDWAAEVVAELVPTHPDLPRKLQRIDLARHGHAMSIPAPGVRGNAALAALAAGTTARLHFAHADLAGYSVFEEAFCAGDAAGRNAARAVRA